MDKKEKTPVVRNKYRAKRFVLDIHGHNKQDFTNLVTRFEHEDVECAIIAKEFGKNKIHPHYQCYFETKEFVASGKSLVERALGHPEFHIEIAKGTKNENTRYCYAVKKPWEIGFVEFAKNVEVPHDYSDIQPNFWRNIELRPFQQAIVNIANKPVCNRAIYWFYELKGNTGKTTLSEYLHIFHGAITTGGKPADMKHAVARWQEITGTNPIIIVVDIQRRGDFNSDSAIGLEEIKNGLFFSGKYESAMVHSVRKPHIFIFSNYPPQKDLFSEDRWKIFKIENSTLIHEP